MMGVLARLHLICTRVAVITASIYNSFVLHFKLEPSMESPMNEWETWIGKLENNLEIPQEVLWQDSMDVVDLNNQKAIDCLNRALERTDNTDDLGEEIEMDESRDISAALVYRPPSTHTTPIKPHTSSSSIVAKTESMAVVASRSEKQHVAPKPAKVQPSLDSTLVQTKDKSKEKLKHKHGEKMKEKQKDKSSSSNSLFALSGLRPSPKLKDKEWSKDKSSSRLRSTEGETKKRKKNTDVISDEIDDLFGLLTPDNKKHKGH
jgi:LAS superfamily LD-carboxypeptidase LdcB